jgi:hypothetical protein
MQVNFRASGKPGRSKGNGSVSSLVRFRGLHRGQTPDHFATVFSFQGTAYHTFAQRPQVTARLVGCFGSVTSW